MVFCVPAANEVVVIAGGALTVMLSAWVAVWALASVTCAVKLLVPVPVGVPEITPELVASVNPTGSVPALIDQE